MGAPTFWNQDVLCALVFSHAEVLEEDILISWSYSMESADGKDSGYEIGSSASYFIFVIPQALGKKKPLY